MLQVIGVESHTYAVPDRPSRRHQKQKVKQRYRDHHQHDRRSHGRRRSSRSSRDGHRFHFLRLGRGVRIRPLPQSKHTANTARYITVEDNEGDKNDLDPWHNGNDLVKAVAAANKKTIVVVHSTGPVILESVLAQPNVVAVVWAGIPGQESGNALADVLYGDVAPSGKLPYTIAKKESDYGTEWIAGGGDDEYPEGIFIDYRHFDHDDIEPRYEFGFGLCMCPSTFTISRDPTGKIKLTPPRQHTPLSNTPPSTSPSTQPPAPQPAKSKSAARPTSTTPSGPSPQQSPTPATWTAPKSPSCTLDSRTLLRRLPRGNCGASRSYFCPRGRATLRALSSLVVISVTGMW